MSSRIEVRATMLESSSGNELRALKYRVLERNTRVRGKELAMLDGSERAIEHSDSGQERELCNWQLVDRRLRGYARKRAALDAAESFDLVRAADMRMHAMFGFSTFMEYMERRLGYVPHTARERLRVARALVVPAAGLRGWARQAASSPHHS